MAKAKLTHEDVGIVEKRRVKLTHEEAGTVLRALSLLMTVKRELNDISQHTLSDASKNPAREELAKITRLMNQFYF
jgi:hypothetical protein